MTISHSVTDLRSRSLACLCAHEFLSRLSIVAINKAQSTTDNYVVVCVTRSHVCSAIVCRWITKLRNKVSWLCCMADMGLNSVNKGLTNCRHEPSQREVEPSSPTRRGTWTSDWPQTSWRTSSHIRSLRPSLAVSCPFLAAQPSWCPAIDRFTSCSEQQVLQQLAPAYLHRVRKKAAPLNMSK